VGIIKKKYKWVGWVDCVVKIIGLIVENLVCVTVHNILCDVILVGKNLKIKKHLKIL